MLQGTKDTAGYAEPRTGDTEIGDYAIIGDCRTAAIVSRDGSIDWLCLPHFSGPSVFAALLDQERGGRFRIRPEGRFRTLRRYCGATAVLETTFETPTGSARLIDAMPVVEDADTLHPLREVLRIIEGIEGEVPFEVDWSPRPDYARGDALIRSRGALGWSCSRSDEIFFLRAEAPLNFSAEAAAVIGRIRVEAGRRIRFSLCYGKADIAVITPLGKETDERLQSTLAWWQSWSSQCVYAGAHREPVIRSAITLKLMTFALSGAVLAAPTTSLPEWIGAERNWDYRYCWLRDAALTMRAFTGLGFRSEAG